LRAFRQRRRGGEPCADIERQRLDREFEVALHTVDGAGEPIEPSREGSLPAIGVIRGQKGNDRRLGDGRFRRALLCGVNEPVPMLTDMAIKRLKPKEKLYKVADRDGMYVSAATTGQITFRYDYRLNGRRETLTIGRYGADGLTLAEARERCITARKQVAEGLSPAHEKQRDKRRKATERSFGAASRQGLGSRLRGPLQAAWDGYAEMARIIRCKFCGDCPCPCGERWS